MAGEKNPNDGCGLEQGVHRGFQVQQEIDAHRAFITSLTSFIVDYAKRQSSHAVTYES